MARPRRSRRHAGADVEDNPSTWRPGEVREFESAADAHKYASAREGRSAELVERPGYPDYFRVHPADDEGAEPGGLGTMKPRIEKHLTEALELLEELGLRSIGTDTSTMNQAERSATAVQAAIRQVRAL